ncbi:hypothetical protein DFJ63DRAFT_336689 [Scheffersomyces coipomensis]|uniref:uncharacterized protein n=1 Tax=Scheffersomyces coipomensis TaxID=1788519 RepID=UPI00315C757B
MLQIQDKYLYKAPTPSYTMTVCQSVPSPTSTANSAATTPTAICVAPNNDICLDRCSSLFDYFHVQCAIDTKPSNLKQCSVIPTTSSTTSSTSSTNVTVSSSAFIMEISSQNSGALSSTTLEESITSNENEPDISLEIPSHVKPSVPLFVLTALDRPPFASSSSLELMSSGSNSEPNPTSTQSNVFTESCTEINSSNSSYKRELISQSVTLSIGSIQSYVPSSGQFVITSDEKTISLETNSSIKSSGINVEPSVTVSISSAILSNNTPNTYLKSSIVITRVTSISSIIPSMSVLLPPGHESISSLTVQIPVTN